MGALEGIGYYFSQLVSGVKVKSILATMIFFIEVKFG